MTTISRAMLSHYIIDCATYAMSRMDFEYSDIFSPQFIAETHYLIARRTNAYLETEGVDLDDMPMDTSHAMQLELMQQAVKKGNIIIAMWTMCSFITENKDNFHVFMNKTKGNSSNQMEMTLDVNTAT